MAHRLYPKTDKSENLDKIVGVPIGTHAQWKPLWEDFINNSKIGSLDEMTKYQACVETPELAKMNHFMMHGFGKFRFCDQMGYAGQVTNLADAAQMLVKHDILERDAVEIAELSEGLVWS